MEKRTIVVTGVTRGLGLAMARSFVKLGHTVVGCGTTEEELEKISKEFGHSHSISPVDVTSTEQVQQWAGATIREFGVPDLLINNAATINQNANLWEVSPAEFSKIVDVNIKGVHHVICAFVPAMVERRSGIIVNFSSTWGRSTSENVAPYCATKWAIEGLTQAMSQELPRGMATLALNPGVINTDMLRTCFGPSASSFPDPETWAKKAVPLILGFNESHNGQSLNVSD